MRPLKGGQGIREIKMKSGKKRINVNLYHKFALAMILLGLFPMLVLSTFMMNHMLKEYRNSLAQNYEQAAIHISSSVENMLSVYNNASKSVYSYEPGSQKQGMDYSSGFDNVRQILTGEIYDPQERSSQRESEMRLFLQNIENMDGYLYAVHFLADSEETGKLTFHFSRRNTFFNNEDKFYQAMDYGNWDKTSKNLLLVPTHKADYYNGMSSDVFTVARNYFDIRGEIGREKYIGTLFQDIDIEKLRLISKKVHIDGAQSIWLLNGQGDCFFSTDEEQIGRNLVREGLLPADSKDTMVISTGENGYGLKVVIAVDTREAFGRISSIQVTMYLFLAICAAALLLASIYFSRKLTQPIHNMMEQMSQVESGNFDIQLPVESGDEIGVLSERFNRMSWELKNYINQSYVAQIKKNEAELTALKSQIYPHFLYNTLEIIRMTALDNQDEQVSQMIEALSEQIHYLIGPMQDMVPLEKEVEIVRKYVYLLNCRISGKVYLNVKTPGSHEILVPKLILQPLVENAYVHGIKPKNGRGSIMIETSERDRRLELSVIDNGVGMKETEIEKLKEFLSGEEPGIKNEYNWQSIGLKNVHDRIRFLYGEEYGIRITSTVGVGTMIQVLLPYEKARHGGRNIKVSSCRRRTGDCQRNQKAGGLGEAWNPDCRRV